MRAEECFSIQPHKQSSPPPLNQLELYPVFQMWLYRGIAVLAVLFLIPFLMTPSREFGLFTTAARWVSLFIEFFILTQDLIPSLSPTAQILSVCEVGTFLPLCESLCIYWPLTVFLIQLSVLTICRGPLQSALVFATLNSLGQSANVATSVFNSFMK